jgi:hypothetical protein
VTDRAKGYQRDCPRFYVNGHNGSKSSVRYLEDAHGCWIWQRTRNAQGYGRLWDRGKMRLAHVVWYERHVGPIPAGFVLHHTCGRGHDGCMNPAHLTPVTPAENARLGRGTKLNVAQVRQIRLIGVGGRRTKTDIARQFGVSDVQIHHILTGRCWAA